MFWPHAHAKTLGLRLQLQKCPDDTSTTLCVVWYMFNIFPPVHILSWKKEQLIWLIFWWNSRVCSLKRTKAPQSKKYKIFKFFLCCSRNLPKSLQLRLNNMQGQMKVKRKNEAPRLTSFSPKMSPKWHSTGNSTQIKGVFVNQKW